MRVKVEAANRLKQLSSLPDYAKSIELYLTKKLHDKLKHITTNYWENSIQLEYQSSDPNDPIKYTFEFTLFRGAIIKIHVFNNEDDSFGGTKKVNLSLDNEADLKKATDIALAMT